jgi:hypothetical protein
MLRAAKDEWSFFFSLDPSVDHLGSSDVFKSIEDVASSPKFTKELSQDVDRRKVELRDNESIAENLFGPILYARMLVFLWFLKTVKQKRELQEADKLLWLQLQLFPRSVLHVDIFRLVSQDVIGEGVVAKAFGSLYAAVMEILEQKISRCNLFLFIDEIQKEKFPHAFRSSRDLSDRSELRQLLFVWRKMFDVFTTKVWFIMSGTGLRHRYICEVLSSVVAKSKELKVYSHVEVFDTKEKMEAYMKKFIPLRQLESDDKKLIRRIYWWLRGRSVILPCCVVPH